MSQCSARGLRGIIVSVVAPLLFACFVMPTFGQPIDPNTEDEITLSVDEKTVKPRNSKERVTFHGSILVKNDGDFEPGFSSDPTRGLAVVTFTQPVPLNSKYWSFGVNINIASYERDFVTSLSDPNNPPPDLDDPGDDFGPNGFALFFTGKHIEGPHPHDVPNDSFNVELAYLQAPIGPIGSRPNVFPFGKEAKYAVVDFESPHPQDDDTPDHTDRGGFRCTVIANRDPSGKGKHEIHVKDYYLFAQHLVPAENTSYDKDFLAFGSTQGTFGFDATTQQLSIQVADIDIISETPTYEATNSRSGDPLDNGLMTVSGLDYQSFDPDTNLYTFGGGDLIVEPASGPGTYQAVGFFDNLFYNPESDQAYATLSHWQFSETEPDEPDSGASSTFLQDLSDMHILGTGLTEDQRARLGGIQFVIPIADLETLTDQFTASVTAQGPVIVTQFVSPDYIRVTGEGSFGSPVEIILEDQDLGKESGHTTGVRLVDSTVNLASQNDTALTLVQPFDGSAPVISVDNSQLVATVNVNLGRNAVVDLTSNTDFAFSQTTFTDDVRGVDTDLAVINRRFDTSGGYGFNTLDLGQQGILHVANAFGSADFIIADSIRVDTGGSIGLNDMGSRFMIRQLTIGQDSQFEITGQFNPLPNMTEPIQMYGGTIGNFEDGFTQIAVGVDLMGGDNHFTTRNIPFTSITEFGGPLTVNWATADFDPQDEINSRFQFTGVEHMLNNGLLPCVTFAGGEDFAAFNPTKQWIERITDYSTSLSTADPGDVVRIDAPTTQLSSDKTLAALKLDRGAGFTGRLLDLGGHTLTLMSLLDRATFGATLQNGTLMPAVMAGEDPPHPLILFADRLSLKDVKIPDNGDTSTTVVVTGRRSSRFDFDRIWSKTGDTYFNDVSATFASGADPGGEKIYATGDATIILQGTTLTQSLVYTPGLFGANLNVDGTCEVKGDISVVGGHWVPVGLSINLPAVDDRLLLSGDIVGDRVDEAEDEPFFLRFQGRGEATIDVEARVMTGGLDVEATVRNNGEIERSPSTAPPGTSGAPFTVGSRHTTGGSDLPVITGDGLWQGTVIEVFAGIFNPDGSIATLTFDMDVVFSGVNGPAVFHTDLDGAGQADQLDISGKFDLAGSNDALEIDLPAESTLNGSYTLATFAEIIGYFDRVTFRGMEIVDPTQPGAVNGTHHLVYGENALSLTASN